MTNQTVDQMCNELAERALGAAVLLQAMWLPNTEGNVQVATENVLYAQSYLRMIPQIANRIIIERTLEMGKRDYNRMMMAKVR